MPCAVHGGGIAAGGFLRWPPRDTGHAPALIKPANAQQITVSASSSNL